MSDERITVNGVEYVRADLAEPSRPGKRYVVVLDRGWIVAGDVEEIDGRLKITRALHVRKWDDVGFDGMIANPKSENVVIKPIPNGFDAPVEAEIFRVPVGDSWGP